jgi:hypothetical protein
MAEFMLCFPRTIAVSSNMPTAHFSPARPRIDLPLGTEEDARGFGSAKGSLIAITGN